MNQNNEYQYQTTEELIDDFDCYVNEGKFLPPELRAEIQRRLQFAEDNGVKQ